jgi:CDP-4-dehydro-6-deoxyglucose reductase
MTSFLVHLQGGLSFSVEEGESLLEGAMRSTVVLPYSCREGRCSACMCKVEQGETIPLQEETGLTAEQKSQGWILSCVRSLKSDVVLDAEDLSTLNLPKAKTLPCKINQIKRLTDDVLNVHLRLPPTSNFQYKAGQYIEVIGAGVKRSYSIANVPDANNVLELQIRRVDSGIMSQYWFEKAKVNDLLRIRGPLGTFCLRDVRGKHLILMATGTGIAPIKAMLEHLCVLDPANQPRRISLYWGGRMASDQYWDPRQLKVTIDYKFVLSTESADQKHKFYIQDAVLRDVSDFSDAVVYACGSPVMIADAQIQLGMSGLSATHFYADAFVVSGTS